MKDKSWVTKFVGLSRLSDELQQRLADNSTSLRLNAGSIVFSPDKIPDKLLLLLSGTVRVQQTSEGGREIVLYRVEAGQSCVMTTACLLAQESYSAEGIAETDIEAIAIPRASFDDMLATSKEFRDFVFTAYSRRITALFKLIDNVAFGRIDMRLADRLLILAGNESEIKVTHQKLATELGTAREVVSRQLQDFQKRGLIAQSRGRITLIEPAKLKQLTAHV